MEKIVKDVKGQDCPIPLITLKEALNTLPDYCDEHDLELVSLDKQPDRSWKISIRNHE